MTLSSVNVSRGRTAGWRGRKVRTGIFKSPVPGPVRVSRLGLEGDRQIDKRYHGGPDKAVYVYSSDYYSWWEKELGRALAPGAFGENLTVAGFDEADCCVGDLYRAGGALLRALEPRLPCYKLGLRFGDASVVKRFQARGWWGVYFGVVEEGELRAGDAFERVAAAPERVPVAELARLRYAAAPEPAALRRALSACALTADWRRILTERAEKA